MKPGRTFGGIRSLADDRMRGWATPPRFVAGAGQMPPLSDDDPRAVPADLVGSVRHMLNDGDREAFRAGPTSAAEELAYAQGVSPHAHMTAVPAPPAAQDRFRRLRQFDRRRFFLVPDGNLYERGDRTAENPGWTLRRQMRGLVGQSDDPTLDDLMHRHFQFVNEDTDAPTDDGQRSAPTSMPQPQQVPQINFERERRQSILDNTPAEFPIAANPDADGSEPAYAIWEEGANAVRSNDSLIEEAAARAGIDPNLLRAGIYVENSQGWYGRVAENLGIAKSLFPANIRPSLWDSLVPDASNLSDPRSNIAAAAILLHRISERVPDGDITKISTLYNSLAKDVVQDYGARVLSVYRSQPWMQPDPRSNVPSFPELGVP